MKLAEQEVEDGTEEEEEEDEWEQQNPEGDSEDSQLECIEGQRNDRSLAMVPAYLTRNKKTKKLMEKARRRVPVTI